MNITVTRTQIEYLFWGNLLVNTLHCQDQNTNVLKNYKE